MTDAHDQPATTPDADDAPDAPVDRDAAPVEAAVEAVAAEPGSADTSVDDAVVERVGPPPAPRGPSAVAAAAIGALVAGAAVAALFLFGVVAAPVPGDVPVEDLIEISDVSERFASALLTYDAEDLDAASATLASVATPGFLELYEQTFAEGLAGSIGEAGGSAVATVREVFVGPIEGDAASAVVVVDATVESDGGTRTLTGVYLRVDLLRGAESGWRVDELTTLTAEDVSLS